MENNHNNNNNNHNSSYSPSGRTAFVHVQSSDYDGGHLLSNIHEERKPRTISRSLRSLFGGGGSARPSTTKGNVSNKREQSYETPLTVANVNNNYDAMSGSLA